MKSVELVERAIREHATFKSAVLILRERPADDHAMGALLHAYREGRAPAWLTAALLGALRAEAAYELVHEMLRTMHGYMIESYAAGAMMQTRGERAVPDLVELAWHAADGRTRNAAAGALTTKETRATILALARAERIHYGTAAYVMTRDGVDQALLHELLSSDAEIDLRIGTECLCDLLRNEESRSVLSSIRERIEPTLRRVLALADFRMSPSKRRTLVAWVGEPAAGL